MSMKHNPIALFQELNIKNTLYANWQAANIPILIQLNVKTMENYVRVYVIKMMLRPTKPT